MLDFYHERPELRIAKRVFMQLLVRCREVMKSRPCRRLA